MDKQNIYSVIICGWSCYDSMWVPYYHGGTLASDRTWSQALQIARVWNKGLGRARKHLRIFPMLQDEIKVRQDGRLALAA
jgi:hypothetical protein